MVRQIMCYICRQPFVVNLIPDKCDDCGESVFINLEYLVQPFQGLYKPEAKELLKEKEYPATRNEDLAEVVSLKEINVFSGFAYQDQEDDVDFFASLEDDQFMIFEAILNNPKLITPKMFQVPGFQHNPCVVVATDAKTGQVISRMRNYFDRPVGYRNGKVIYGTTQSMALNLSRDDIKVCVYTDLMHITTDDFDIEVL